MCPGVCFFMFNPFRFESVPWWLNLNNVCMHPKLLQSFPTLWDPINCIPPGSSVPGIFQAWILEWLAIPFSRGSSKTRDWTHISYISCTTWEAQTLITVKKILSLYLFKYSSCSTFSPFYFWDSKHVYIRSSFSLCLLPSLLHFVFL